jgi:hypothetical protein
MSWRNKVKKRIAMAVILAVLFAAFAYAQTARYFVYVANTGSNNVSTYAVNQ